MTIVSSDTFQLCCDAFRLFHDDAFTFLGCGRYCHRPWPQFHFSRACIEKYGVNLHCREVLIVSGETIQDIENVPGRTPERHQWKWKCRLGRNDICTLWRDIWLLRWMLASRYELSESHWERIEDHCLGARNMRGVRPRTTANSSMGLRVLRSEARWSGLPEHFGKYKGVHRRFLSWAQSGDADLPRIGAEPEESIPDDRFDPGARPSAGGHGPQKGRRQGFGAYPGCLTIKIYQLAGELGLSLAITIIAGQVAGRTTLSPCSESARRNLLSPIRDKIPMLWSSISRPQAPK